MDFQTATALSLPLVFAAMMLLEPLIGAGRPMPAIRGWRAIGAAGLTVSLLCNALMPLVLLPLLPKWRAAHLAGWGLWGALPTLVLTTFFTYWSHRIQHRFDILWRLGHQLHHGVARVDIASAMIFHPVDLMVQIVMTLLAAQLLGVTPDAAALAGGLGFFVALYQHWNIATPAWTGWFIQRPEAHILHHAFDVHARNFGDMPIWDRLFGTYAEPTGDEIRVGFSPEAMRRWPAMIAFVDVNAGSGRARL